MAPLYRDDDDDQLTPEQIAAIRAVGRKLSAARREDALTGWNRFAKYENDIVGFSVEVLCVVPWESPDPEQQGQTDVLLAIQDNDLVAVKAGQKVSKTMSAIIVALWWICCRKNAKCVMTAPVFDQVKFVIWEQLTLLWEPKIDNGETLPPFRPGLKDVFGIDLPLDPSTGIRLNGNLMRGMSTKKPERAAGVSSDKILYIIDEASGFPSEIFQPIFGNLAGGGKIFAITNPTVTSGWLFELFRNRTSGWKLMTLSSENSPNAVSGKKLIPGVALRSYIEMVREQCAPGSTVGRVYRPTHPDDPWAGHPFYMVRILGQFPPQGADAIIGITMIDRATGRWRADAQPESADLVLGVDIAESGDDLTVIQPVRGYYAYQPIEMRKAEGDEVAAKIVSVARAMRISKERIRVNLDGIGVGKGPYNVLKFSEAVQEGWITVCSLNVGMKADVDSGSEIEDYANLRSQLWFGLAQWLRDGGKIPNHSRMISEMLAANAYPNSRGQLKVEEKKLMKVALGGKSPDYADALCLATYRGTQGQWIDFSEVVIPADKRHPGPETLADWGGGGNRKEFKWGS